MAASAHCGAFIDTLLPGAGHSRRMTVTNRAAEVGRRSRSDARTRDVEAAVARTPRPRLRRSTTAGAETRYGTAPKPGTRLSASLRNTVISTGTHWPSVATVWLLPVYGGLTTPAMKSTDLNVIEIDDDGRIVYEGRFDDDFEAAYRELDRRYYLGEGADFAEAGSAQTEAIVAVNRHDYDRLFGELSSADLQRREPVQFWVSGSLRR